MSWGPAQVHNGDNGDTADDFYHRFQDDIEIMRSLGVKMFRMSLSWSRILPAGTGKVGADRGLSRQVRACCCMQAHPCTSAAPMMQPEHGAQRWGPSFRARQLLAAPMLGLCPCPLTALLLAPRSGERPAAAQYDIVLMPNIPAV